eukprot:3933373-Rhodomonas_salina.1
MSLPNLTGRAWKPALWAEQESVWGEMSLRNRQPSPKSESLTTLKSEALRLRGGADTDPDDPFAEMYGEKEDSEALEGNLCSDHALGLQYPLLTHLMVSKRGWRRRQRSAPHSYHSCCMRCPVLIRFYAHQDWSVSEEDENGNVRGCGQVSADALAMLCPVLTQRMRLCDARD